MRAKKFHTYLAWFDINMKKGEEIDEPSEERAKIPLKEEPDYRI
jgi:hypothetical protein